MRKRKRFFLQTFLFFLLLTLVKLQAIWAFDFTYSGPDCTIIYRFSPSTGTLSDLRVIYNQSFSFLPSNYGGITLFSLGGSLLRPREGKQATKVLEETNSGGIYTAKFRWTYNGENFDFAVSLQLSGKTLKIEYYADPLSQNVLEFSLERTEKTPDPKVVEMPYGHNVLFTNGIFISAILDSELSNSSTLSPLKTRFSSSSASFAYASTYRQLTDGRRNALQETVHLTVSPKIEDVFFRVLNPVSPYKNFLSNRVILDLWRKSFADCKNDLELLSSFGMRDLFAIIHVWQKYGYDDGLPSTYPAGNAYGGDLALREVSDLCLRNGYLLALHTNYVDFYPNSDVWTPSDLALEPNGTWVKSWYNLWTGTQSYLMKPSRALYYSQMYEPSIHDSYSTTASFLDVHTAILPSFKVDYDSRIPQAGKQKETFRYYKELLSYARNLHGGPVAGEGYGYSTSTWAGYVDAMEADPRSLFDSSRFRSGTQVPILVDYKLKVLHGLFVPHGAGYLERFYLDKYSNYEDWELERYRATEIAFANAGFISNSFDKGISLLEVLRDYCFLKHLQSYYLDASPLEILYNVRGAMKPLSEALQEILPGLSFNSVDDVLLEELAMVKVTYDNGFVLYVNRSQSVSWSVIEGGTSYLLPPGGFLARKGNEFLAYTALVNGVKSYYLWPAEGPCLGNLIDIIYSPLNFQGKKVMNRSLFQLEYINILAWEANPANKNIAKYRIYQVEEKQRIFLAEVDSSILSYWHRKVEKTKLYNYALVAVNDEGREGQLALLAVQ